jgi:hypothetical protein
MPVIINGSTGVTTSTGVFSDASGNVGIGTTSPTAMAGKSLQISDRSAFFQLTVNNSTYIVNNLYFDGTNWRYIVTGTASLMTLDSGGTTAFYRAASGTAGAVATLIPNLISDASSNFFFNSGFGSAGVAYGCRAWVNFNGTGTVAIRASGNVSSITDNGVGLYTVNFTTAMPDANYAVAVAGGILSSTAAYGSWDTPTTASVRVGNQGIFNSYAPIDGAFYAVAIFR